MLFVLISVILVVVAFLANRARKNIGGDDQESADHRAVLATVTTVCLLLFLATVFTAIGIHISASHRIARLQAYHDANFQIDKVIRFDETVFYNAEGYNQELAMLHAEDQDIWIGVAYPHVPEDLDYIQKKDLIERSS